MALEHTHGSQFQTALPSSSAQALVEENFDHAAQPNGLDVLNYNTCARTGEGHAPSDGSWNANQASKSQPQSQLQQRLSREGTGLHRSQHLSAALNHIYY
jgi:hypothetical protein